MSNSSTTSSNPTSLSTTSLSTPGSSNKQNSNSEQNNISYDEFIKKKKLEIRRNNVQQVISDIEKRPLPKYLENKLKNNLDLYKGILYPDNIDTVIKLADYLKDNKVGLRGFEKDPGRQNLDEKLQLEFYSKKNNIPIKTLNKSGDSSLCFDKERIVICSIKQANFKKTKTFDAVFINNDITYYILAKHTEESGGAQDNQINDLIDQIEYAIKYYEKNKTDNNITNKIKFICMISGKYILSKPKLDKIKQHITENYKSKIFIQKPDDNFNLISA